MFRHAALIFVLVFSAPGAFAADARLDALAHSIEARLKVMRGVAHYKWEHHIPVEAPEREAAVIKATVTRATELGLDEQLATRAVTAQMEAAKAVQRKLIAAWEQGEDVPEGQAPDLAGEIRPLINDLTAEFLTALKAAAPLLESCAALYRPNAVTPDVWSVATAGLNPEACD
ncbi:gamma subclass chorismate mutase AroQ [Kordiimonas gwangyangensis]|uniref:gamma subclass chorismate mutase AroQ n=1 Tax=Kordiimonas gwangyangensis TaxID=288022 RepID=UPI00039A9C8E|nr:gamma subclass chorismate mutase AroQ [Kordiimonas gwangyangensis]